MEPFPLGLLEAFGSIPIPAKIMKLGLELLALILALGKLRQERIRSFSAA